MSIWGDFVGAFKKYATFGGRATRHEFWSFVLVNFVISFVLGFLDQSGVFSGIYWLLTIIPSLAVGVRRLHDTDRSGWWLLIGLVPLVGFIVLLVFYVSKSSQGPNRFDGVPVAAAPAPAPAAPTPPSAPTAPPAA